MRVIQVTDYGSPFAGSFVPMLSATLAEAARRGWDAQAVLPDRARTRDWLPALAEHEERLLFAPSLSRRALRRWLWALVEEKPGPTLLHAHFTVFDYAVAAVAARRPDVRAFWHVHTVLSQRPVVRIANRYKLRWTSRDVERILCVAPHLAEAIITRGAPPSKVLYFPNAIDTRAFAPPAERTAARARLGLPADGRVLLHFGRDWDAKGGDLFLDAVRRLRERDGRIVAASARGGEPARSLAAALGIEDALVTLDHVPDTRDLYAAADLLVASSRGEGMPLTVLEALASGVPVVASAIPGHHIPDADLPALRIAPLDAEGLALAAAELLAREPAQAEAEAEAGRRWLEREMDVRPWASRLLDLYEQAR